MHKTYIKRVGSINILARRSILNEFVDDLAISINVNSITAKSKIWIFCGAHKNYYLNWFRPGKKVVIQTEQFYDDNGIPMWGQGYIKNKILINNIRKSDLFIELSESNRKFYEEDLKLPQNLLSKIIFGPYIFPSKRKNEVLDNNSCNEVVFFGTLNARRLNCIKNLPFAIKTLNGVYGKKLKDTINDSRAVLNVHYEPGVYTEWPRVLSAFHNRKILISETLSKVLEPDLHYALIDNSKNFNDFNDKVIFENLEHLVTTQYSITNLINTRFA